MDPVPDLELARLVRRHFARDLWPEALAVAWAESDGVPDAAGDPLTIYPERSRDQFARFACNDRTSFGLWQVNLPSHADTLRFLTGSADPCDWARYLENPENNARIAAEIAEDRRRNGLHPLSAWTAWNQRTHEPYLPRARAALAAAEAADGVIVAQPSEHLYVVRPGDTLSSIAERMMGSPDLWQSIYARNRDVIGDDPDLILPGMRLIIPQVQPSQSITDPLGDLEAHVMALWDIAERLYSAADRLADILETLRGRPA